MSGEAALVGAALIVAAIVLALLRLGRRLLRRRPKSFREQLTAVAGGREPLVRPGGGVSVSEVLPQGRPRPVSSSHQPHGESQETDPSGRSPQAGHAGKD